MRGATAESVTNTLTKVERKAFEENSIWRKVSTRLGLAHKKCCELMVNIRSTYQAILSVTSAQEPGLETESQNMTVNLTDSEQMMRDL